MLWVLIQQCHLVRFFFYCLLYDFMLCIYSAVALAQHATDEYESKLSVIVGYLHKSSLLYFYSLYTSIQRYLRLTKPWNSALHNVNGEILCFVICEIWARTRSERVKSFAMKFFFVSLHSCCSFTVVRRVYRQYFLYVLLQLAIIFNSRWLDFESTKKGWKWRRIENSMLETAPNRVQLNEEGWVFCYFYFGLFLMWYKVHIARFKTFEFCDSLKTKCKIRQAAKMAVHLLFEMLFMFFRLENHTTEQKRKKNITFCWMNQKTQQKNENKNKICVSFTPSSAFILFQIVWFSSFCFSCSYCESKSMCFGCWMLFS